MSVDQQTCNLIRTKHVTMIDQKICFFDRSKKLSFLSNKSIISSLDLALPLIHPLFDHWCACLQWLRPCRSWSCTAPHGWSPPQRAFQTNPNHRCARRVRQAFLETSQLLFRTLPWPVDHACAKTKTLMSQSQQRSTGMARSLTQARSQGQSPYV